MNESIEPDLQEIEAELRRFRPAPVPPRLKGALAESLRPVAPSRRRWPVRGALLGAFGAGAIAAAGAAALLLRSPRVTPAASPSVLAADFKAVSAESVVASTTDDGEVVLDDGTHARRVEAAVVDTVVWRDPRTRATVSWSAPSGEVRFIPVSYQ